MFELDINYIDINEFEKKLNLNKSKIIAIFYADWCKYCIANVPFIKRHLDKVSSKKVFFINVKEDDVWKETKSKWDIKVVPTIRVYNGNKIIFEHANVATQKEIDKALEKVRK